MIDHLLDFCEKLSYEDIPEDVVAQSKRCLLDWVGVTLGGMAHPAIKILKDAAVEFGGNPHATILGTSIRTSMYQAAFVNGTASHVLDFDDTHLGALMHPSVTVIPAALSFGESRRVNGREFLSAYLAGFEVETRISMAMGASHYDAGWHATASMGRFGAAAAVARLAGLRREQAAMALGLAGTQASGLRKVFGTMSKPFHAGKAAADGLLSAILAGKGFTCSSDILTGEKGLGRIFSEDYKPERGLAGLGESFSILGVSIKPFASCLYTHPTIDGVIQLRNRYDIRPEQVKRIRCRVSKFCVDSACQTDPREELACKFSTYYCAAVAISEGKAGAPEFRPDRIFTPEYRSLMQRVTIEKAQDLTDDQAEVAIELTDGRILERKVDYPLGDPRNPLSDSDVEKKFRDLCGVLLPPERLDAIVEKVMNFESVGQVGELTEMCCMPN